MVDLRSKIKAQILIYKKIKFFVQIAQILAAVNSLIVKD